MSMEAISSAIRSYLNAPPVGRPPTKMTYAPTVSQDFRPSSPPAAIITLSEAAQNWLRYQRASSIR